MITLYSYQQDIINEIQKKWKEKKKRLVVCSPGGSGKTVMFCYMAMEAAKKGNKTLILTHREELLFQTGGTLEKLNLKPILITAKTKHPPKGDVFVGMVETITNRLKTLEWQEWFKGISLIVNDEIHEQVFNKFFDSPLTDDKYILGFSATPSRKGNQRQLSEDYEDIIFGPDVQTLINEGFLVTDRYYSVPVDMKGVKISKGDFDSEQMFNRYDKKELYDGLIENWLNICPDTITIVFCCNIQHSINTCKALNEAGIKSKFLVSAVSKPEPIVENATEGEKVKFNIKNAEYQNYISNLATLSGDRKEVMKEWKRGDFIALVNSGIATTGVDYPAIQTVILNRATTSENLLIQMIVRGSRKYEGKTFFTTLDFGDNCKRLNTYYRLAKDYSLDHEVSKAGEGVGGVKDCPKCGALLPMSMMICKYCGHIWQKTHEQVIVDLVEVNYGEAVKELKNIKDYEIFADAKKYNKNWLFRMIYMKFGREGLIEYQKEHHLAPSWVFICMARFNAQGIKSNK